MKNLCRWTLVLVALSLILSACLPFGRIEEKVSGIEDGTTKIGPSWPVTMSIPMLKRANLEVGESLDGFEGTTLNDNFATIDHSLGDIRVGIGFQSKQIQIDHPGIQNPPPIDLPTNQFETPLNIDEIVTAKLSTGSIRVELHDIKPAVGNQVAISLKDPDDNVISQLILSGDQTSGLLPLHGVNLTSQMLLTADGKLQFTGNTDGTITIEAEEPFILAEVELASHQLSSRFPSLVIDEMESIQLPDDIRINEFALDMELDLAYDNFSAQNMDLTLVVDLTAFDKDGNFMNTIPTTTKLEPGLNKLTPLTNELSDLVTNAAVGEIEIYMNKVLVEAADPSDNVLLQFSGEPTVSGDARLSIASLDGDSGASINVSTTFEMSDDVPEELIGGTVVFTIDNHSPVRGTLDIWFSDAASSAPLGTPDVSIRISPDAVNQNLEASLNASVLDLFRNHEEIRMTMQLSNFSAIRKVEQDDVMFIDAYGVIAGRVNK